MEAFEHEKDHHSLPVLFTSSSGVTLSDAASTSSQKRTKRSHSKCLETYILEQKSRYVSLVSEIKKQ